jgi:hypothetical protein
MPSGHTADRTAGFHGGVAAVPEVSPAVVTIALVVGQNRMRVEGPWYPPWGRRSSCR